MGNLRRNIVMATCSPWIMQVMASFWFVVPLLVSPMVSGFSIVSPSSRVCSRGGMQNIVLLRPFLYATKQEDDDASLIIELPDDNDDNEASTVSATYQDFCTELVELAEKAKQDPDVVPQAMDVFDRLFQAYVVSEDAHLLPDLNIYRHVLRVYATGGASHQAKDLLERMRDSETAPNPDSESYAILMDACIRNHSAQEAVAVFEMYHEPGDPSSSRPMQNKLVKAYGVLGQPDQAAEVFHSIQSPDEESYTQLLRAYARAGNATAIQDWMHRPDFRPNVPSYNAYLQVQKSGKAAERILYDLMEDDLTPDATSFYHVFHAYRKDRRASALKVEQLVALYDSFGLPLSEPRKEGKVLLVAMAAMAKDSMDSKRPLRVKKLMDRLDRPHVWAYQSFLRACQISSENSQEKLETFQMALAAFRQAVKMDDCDWRVYHTFLWVIRTLLPPSQKRDSLAELTFQKCCADGWVHDNVLEAFEGTASKTLVLQSFGPFQDTALPQSWRRNIH